MSVDSSVIEELVSEEVLEGTSEAELVSGVMQWSKVQCINANLPLTLENRRHFMGDKILSKLRFLAFPQLSKYHYLLPDLFLLTCNLWPQINYDFL